MLHGRYDKIDLPPIAPVVTRVERYAGRCRCCGGTTLAPVPERLEPGMPFSIGIVALSMYLRFVHAISYQRLCRLLLELFGLAISEGALDAAFRRGKLHVDAEVAMTWHQAPGANTDGVSNIRSTPSWHWRPPTVTASTCESDTANTARTYSRSSTILKCRPTTTVPSANCGRQPFIARSPAFSAPTGALTCSQACAP